MIVSTNIHYNSNNNKDRPGATNNIVNNDKNDIKCLHKSNKDTIFAPAKANLVILILTLKIVKVWQFLI